MADNSVVAEIISGAGVVISAGLAAFSTIRNARDKGERAADRRNLEERTTDRILTRVYAELDRAYEFIDEQEMALQAVRDWIWANRAKFDQCGVTPAPRLNVSRASLRADVEKLRAEMADESDDKDKPQSEK
jgi:hypothetical protein